MSRWTAQDLPDQSGRTYVITGSNSGIGEVAARELARAGARVVLAVRTPAKGEEAARRMSGDVSVEQLDLADLASVRAFAERVTDPVDVLINNAGLMAVPESRTADGFEMQIGTNHLGHFALTGLLLDRIGDRVVNLASGAHRIPGFDVDDLNWERRKYDRWKAYGQSKVSNLLFTYELQRRLDAAGSPVRALAAHPGYAATNLQTRTQSFQDAIMGVLNKLVAQSAEMGALPTLYAATQDLPGGTYVGPDGFQEARGHPEVVDSNALSKDHATADRLWERSEQLTGVTFPLPVA